MEAVASLSQGRTAAAQCGLFTHKSVPVIFEPPCSYLRFESSYALIFRVENTNNLLCDNFMESGQYDDDDEEEEEEEDKNSPLLGPFSDAIFDDPTDIQVFWHVTSYLRAEEVKRLR